LIPPVHFQICLALMAQQRWLWPVRIIFPFPYNLLGTAPILAGLLIGFWGVWQFRRAGTKIRPYREPDVFVTEGPYRYTRNPMYLGVSLVLLGVWILLGAVSSVVGPPIYVFAADRFYIPFEEQRLREKFGAAFDAYCARTRRWI
jgi:protein-S-isoprenylcysteine O-methyltransferase Ste14